MMRTSTFTLTTSDGDMEVYEAAPDGEAVRGVIVIQEAFGVNDHVRDVTRRFAAAGYHAVAPALFHRAGGGTAAYGDMEAVMKLFAGLTDEGFLTDVDACIDHLGFEGFAPERVGVVGFCMGGRVTFLVAACRRLGAAVGFYGGGIVEAGRLPFPALIDGVPNLQTPWLGLFGDLDAGIPVEHVERLRAELDTSAPVDHEIVRYPGAQHGFHCDPRPDNFNAEAAADGWGRTLDWLSAHLAPVPAS
jgi:carboxymethylenebutenolidase